MSIRFAALVAAAGLVGLPALAEDELAPDKAAHCLPHAALVHYLDRAFEEARVATASLDEGMPVELYLSRRGTWTLVEVHPDGLGCIHAYGERMHLERTLGRASLPARTG